MRPNVGVERLKFIFHNLTKVTKSRHTPPAEITPEGARHDPNSGGGIGDPIGKSHLGGVLGLPGFLDFAGQHGGGLGGLGGWLGSVERRIDGRGADWGRHERIPSHDRANDGAGL